MLFKKTKAHSNDKIDELRLIDDDTPFAINEAFRALYTKVLYLPIEDKCRKIALTSAFSGEGKTYISINLAITLAKNSENKKILLIDADMRKPRVARILSKYFGDKAEEGGLSEYLAGIHDEPNIISTDIPNFSILFSGKESANPIGLINSKKMDELLNKCSEQYDYIILDTPPVTVVSDAVLLADRINGYIMAARADYSNINSLSDAVSIVQNVGGEVFGVVLSSVNPKNARGSYTYKTYKNSGYYS
ncbi:MAG: CpsD/CapB family tyrosine-protein kinase [Clostridia bacterium]|nr:CpsD/CapB family tyrosine-protein kinase [Clostridia bacterium]